MPNLNKVMLIGNCTKDPELRFTPKGTAVCELDLAVNRNWTDGDGVKKEEVTFINCTLWSRIGEIAGEYLKKGDPVFIEGRLQLDTWDDKKTGEKRYKLKVVGESLQLLGRREKGEERPEAKKPAAAPKKAEKDPDLDAVDEDTLPY